MVQAQRCNEKAKSTEIIQGCVEERKYVCINWQQTKKHTTDAKSQRKPVLQQAAFGSWEPPQNRPHTSLCTGLPNS